MSTNKSEPKQYTELPNISTHKNVCSKKDLENGASSNSLDKTESISYDLTIETDKNLCTESTISVVTSSNSIKELNVLPLKERIKESINTLKQTIKEKTTTQQLFYYLKYYIFNKVDLVILGLNIIICVLYSIALFPCNNVLKCRWGMGLKFFNVVAYMDILCTLIASSLFYFYCYTGKHFWHLLYGVPVFWHYFTTYTGTNNNDHGGFNSFLFILFFTLFISIFGIVTLTVYLIRKKKYKILFEIIFTICSFAILYNTNSILDLSCADWDKGLNNTRINEIDRDYHCKIHQPGKNKCYMNALDGWFDFSKMIGYTCESEKARKDERYIFNTFLSAKLRQKNHFGYPITTNRDKFYPTVKEKLDEYQAFILNNIIDMDDYNEGEYKNEPRPEVEVTFDPKTQLGNVSINVIRNETLSKERKEKAKKSKSPYDNVLLIYLDAVSRQNFFRKLGKTVEFLEQFTRYDPNPQTKDFSVFQFLKYQKLKPHTLTNVKPMFYGAGYYDTNGTNIVKHFKEEGFVTGHTGTTCGREIFSVKINEDGDYVKYLDYDSYDHENIALFCDYNFFRTDFPVNRGVNSLFKRCLYGKSGFEHAMEYTLKFWETYPDNKKFFRIHMNEGHDSTNALLGYLNDPLYNFIRTFYDKGWLENTFIVFMSDHGSQLPGPWTLVNSQDYIIEKTLGSLFFMIPNDNRLYSNERYASLMENSQTFVTPYDIYDTLMYLAVGDEIQGKYSEFYSPKGQSLLTLIDHTERYCDNPKFDYRIKKSDCQCINNY